MRYEDVVLADGPVGYWPLNELSGTTAKDLSGNGRDGTYNGSLNLGAYPFPAGGRFPHFDGTDDYVTIADNNAWTVSTTGILCVEAWLRTSRVFGGSSTRQAAVSKLASGNDEWQLVHQTQAAGTYSGASTLPDGRTGVTDSWTFDYFTTTTGANPSTPNNSVQAGVLVHLFARIDASTPYLTIFLNGREASTPDTSIGSAAANGTGPLRIGNRGYNDLYFQGGIGHVALYNKNLPTSRIQAHYRAGIARPVRTAFRSRAT